MVRDHRNSMRHIFSRILDEVASDELGLPLVSIAVSSIVQDPDVVQCRIDGLRLSKGESDGKAVEEVR